MKFIKKLLTNMLIAIAIALPIVLYSTGLYYLGTILPTPYDIVILLGGVVLGPALFMSIVDFLDDIKYK